MKRGVATFYIGHRVNGGREPSWRHDKDIIPALVVAFPSGFTAWEATGGGRGGLVATTVCQVVGITSLEANVAKEMLEFAFQQKEVLCLWVEAEVA